MSLMLTVEGKVFGQKRPLLSDWQIEIPQAGDAAGFSLPLRNLITFVVEKEVDAFTARQETRKLAQVMGMQAIADGAVCGKIDPGGRGLEQTVDLPQAIATALQAFEDGGYFVFIDEEQFTDLDAAVLLRPGNKLLFLRLTALAGG